MALVWLLVALGFAILAAANIHLVYVAVTSEPDCVPHIRQGEGKSGRNEFSAATSSCSPIATTRAGAQAE
jgi:hypothetical protein